MPAPWSLHGRTVLITGAARGIGFATSQLLAARGARVAMVDLEPAVLEEASAAVAGARPFAADVTDADALADAVQGTVEAFGGIDVVVANAGIGSVGFLRSMDAASFERTIEVNLLGAWNTIRASLPHVVERRGYVLAVSSMSAVTPMPAGGPYSASKAAIASLTDVLRMELAHHGVAVGCAYFPFIETPLVQAMDQRPTAVAMKRALPGFLRRPYPVRIAADAMALGIERRSRIVAAPAWAKVAVLATTLHGRLGERQVHKLLPRAEAAWEAEMAAQGAEAASTPIGPGGAAATASAPR